MADLKMPSKKALDAAAKAKADAAGDDGPPPGRVIGVDYDEWATAVIDTSGEGKAAEMRIKKQRRRLKAKGYAQIEGDVQVVGFESAEAWAKPRDEWRADKARRRERIRQAVSQGVMSDTALQQTSYSGPHGSVVA